jgi:hypothetical protein
MLHSVYYLDSIQLEELTLYSLVTENVCKIKLPKKNLKDIYKIDAPVSHV